jgi:hypothetical protein
MMMMMLMMMLLMMQLMKWQKPVVMVIDAVVVHAQHAGEMQMDKCGRASVRS